MALLTLDQLSQHQQSSIAIVGPPKTGKTQCLASAFKIFDRTRQPNNLIESFDLDGDGSISLIRAAKEMGRLDKLRIHRFQRKAGEKINTQRDDGLTPARRPDDWVEFANEFNSLYDQIDTATGQWKDPSNAPGLVVVDSVTSLQEMIWDFILGKRNKEVGIDSRRTGFDEWNLLRSKLSEVLKSAKGLPCHCAFIFHLDYKQEEAGKQQRILANGQVVLEPVYVDGSYQHVPMIVGQLAFSILKDFSVCLESHFRNDKYQWKVVPDERSQSIGSRAFNKFRDRYIDQDLSLVL